MQTTDRPALIVDGMSVLRTVAGPAAHLRNGYTYSFVVQLTAALKKIKPKGIMVCWEGGGFGKRVEIHPGYKADRKETPEVIRRYRDDVKRFLEFAGADQLVAPGYEADDLGGMLSRQLRSAVLFSSDKDWLQLVRPGISVYQKVRGTGKKEEKKLITCSNFAELTGWSTPDEFVRGLCAMGDDVDKVPGVHGVGPAYVKAYLNGMKVPENVTRRLEEFYSGPEFQRNLKLIDIRNVSDLPVEVTPGRYDEGKLRDLLEELTFASMHKKFHEWVLPYREARI